MEGVSERPDTFFRLSPAEPGKAQCFAVKRGNLEGFSLSVPLHTPELRLYLKGLRRNPTASKPLSAYVDVNPPVNIAGIGEDDLVGFIPMQAVSDGATGEYTVTNRPLKEVRKGYTPFINGDTLWAKITPCMQNGKSCIVDRLPNGVGFGSTEFHVLRVRAPGISKEFVMEFVSQASLRRLATYAFTGSAGQQRVPATFLEALPFPELSESRQNEIVASIKAAREAARRLRAEANALLAGIDDFLLDGLGITLPSEDSCRVFAVRLTQLCSDGRLNADYYHPDRLRALCTLDSASGGLTVARLSEVVSFQRNQLDTPGENYLSLAHVQSHTGELTDSADTAQGTCFTYKVGDILFARLRPYLNKVHRAERNGCCSPEFHVLRVRDAGKLLPDYLAAVLRSRMVLAQTVHMMTGNTHPRLTNDDVVNLLIPVAKLEVQEKIVAEIRRRRNEARYLRAEAEAGWQAAKRWFEEQLLGPSAP